MPVRTVRIGRGIHDRGSKLSDGGQRTGLRAAAFNQPALRALEQFRRDGSFNHVAAHDCEAKSARFEF